MKRPNYSIDPRNLIFESYRMDGVGEAECRSIFLDWAIGVPMDEDSTDHVQRLLTLYGPDHPDHPMTHVLRAALNPTNAPKRRGGARGRR